MKFGNLLILLLIVSIGCTMETKAQQPIVIDGYAMLPIAIVDVIPFRTSIFAPLVFQPVSLPTSATIESIKGL